MLQFLNDVTTLPAFLFSQVNVLQDLVRRGCEDRLIMQDYIKQDQGSDSDAQPLSSRSRGVGLVDL